MNGDIVKVSNAYLGSATATSLTGAFDCGSGADYLVVGIAASVGLPAPDVITGVTYNGVAMTRLKFYTPANVAARGCYLYGLAAPASGSHNVVVSVSPSDFVLAFAISYKNAKQTGQPDASGGNDATSTGITATWTTSADRTQGVMIGLAGGGTISAGAGTTLLNQDNDQGTRHAAYQGTALFTPAGSKSLAIANTGSFAHIVAVASLAPKPFCEISGNATVGITETQRRAAGTGGLVVTCTIVGDTLVAAGGTFDAARAAALTGIASTSGTFVANEPVTSVVRTGNNTLTFNLTNDGTYNITSTDTVTITIPASMLVGGVAMNALPTFTVTADAALSAGSVSLASKTATSISLTCTEATGGVGPYTKQWKRKDNSAGSYNNVGTNALSLANTGLASGGLYDYEVLYTDSVGTTATSAPTGNIRTWIDPNNQAIKFTGNWGSDGGGALAGNNIKAGSTYAKSVFPGAQINFNAQRIAGAGKVTAYFDTSAYSFSGATAGKMPTIVSAKDADSWLTTLLAASGSPSGIDITPIAMAVGAHDFEIDFKSIGNPPDANGARWDTPNLGVTFLGLDVDVDAVISAPTIPSTEWLVIGDSLTEGFAILGNSSINANNDSTRSAAKILGANLNARMTLRALAGAGYVRGEADNTASAQHPAAQNAISANEYWDKHYKDSSALVGGLFVPQYFGVLIILGTNDGASALTSVPVTALIDKVRTAAPSAWIIATNAPGGASGNSAAIATGVANAAVQQNTAYVPVTQRWTPASGYTPRYCAEAFSHHPGAYGHEIWGMELARKINDVIAATSAVKFRNVMQGNLG